MKENLPEQLVELVVIACLLLDSPSLIITAIPVLLGELINTLTSSTTRTIEVTDEGRITEAEMKQLRTSKKPTRRKRKRPRSGTETVIAAKGIRIPVTELHRLNQKR